MHSQTKTHPPGPIRVGVFSSSSFTIADEASQLMFLSGAGTFCGCFHLLYGECSAEYIISSLFALAPVQLECLNMRNISSRYIHVQNQNQTPLNNVRIFAFVHICPSLVEEGKTAFSLSTTQDNAL